MFEKAFVLTICDTPPDIVSFCCKVVRQRCLPYHKAAKESSVKRRQLIDGMNYYFNVQFKKYKAEHHRAEREDAWTGAIISKVLCAWLILPSESKLTRYPTSSPRYVSILFPSAGNDRKREKLLATLLTKVRVIP
jgi:hypothetical protein